MWKVCVFTFLFSEFVKEKINIFASLFSNFVKNWEYIYLIVKITHVYCYPYLVRHSGMNVPSGRDYNTLGFDP